MWSAHPVVGFDTETTGIDSCTDRLVTASVIVVDNDGTHKHYWLADPGVEIPDRAAAVHGISTEKARAEGRPIIEVLTEVSALLFEHLAAKHPIVAFNSGYDITLLENELARHGLPTLEEQLGQEIAPILDPFLLDKYVDKWRKGKRKLENVAMHYGVWADDAFHNAEADVLATLRVLAAIAEKFAGNTEGKDITQMSLTELMRVQREVHNESEEYFRNLAIRNGRNPSPVTGWPVAREIQ
ncbi:exonuclease domain-containing protein [Arcanobacterium hippocoleae]